jgi:pimeloyl-ACP methyl ester carboxylesterase
MSHPAIVSRIAHESCLHLPVRKLSHPWWEHLALDFPKEPEPFQLSWVERAQIQPSAALDVVLRTLAASLVGGLALPTGYTPWKLRQALSDSAFYGALAERGDAHSFFHKPDRSVAMDSRPATRQMFRPKDGQCVDLRFQSPFEPVNPNQRDDYLRHKANQKAHARYWYHDHGPRPTIVALHGFTADFYHVNEWFFALPWLFRMGYDVMLVTLPFHGRRQTRFSPFSGHGFFAGGPSRINEAFAQAVFDTRVFIDYLTKQRGVSKVGVTGVSLGGFTTALLASVEDRLSFAVANVPLVSVPDLVMEWQPIGKTLSIALKLLSKTLIDARYLLAVSSPLTYAPVLPREQLMVIGGVGDRLAPPKHSRLLWEHWDRCRLHWFPGSHLLHMDRGAYIKQFRRFLHAIHFSPRRT